MTPELLAAPRRRGMPIAGAAGVATLLGLIALKLTLYVAIARADGGVEALCQFDCQWYLHTAEHGYDVAPVFSPGSDAANWAFFPLFPALTRLVMAVTTLPSLWAGTAVALLSFAGFALLSREYRRLTRPRPDHAAWLGVLFLYPFSLYFFVPYTESSYLLGTVLVLLAVRVAAPTAAGAATGLLTATRPTGVLAIPAVAIVLAWRAWPGLRHSADRWRHTADLLFALALLPLGIACYMAWLYLLTGDALAFRHVEAVWGRHIGDPLRAFYWNLVVGDWHILLQSTGPESRSYNVLWAVPAAAGCAWLLARRLVLEAWLLGSTALLALSTGPESYPRYVAANPVFLLLVGDVVDRLRSRPARIALAGLALALQAVLLHRWLLGSRLLM